MEGFPWWCVSCMIMRSWLTTSLLLLLIEMDGEKKAEDECIIL